MCHFYATTTKGDFQLNAAVAHVHFTHWHTVVKSPPKSQHSTMMYLAGDKLTKLSTQWAIDMNQITKSITPTNTIYQHLALDKLGLTISDSPWRMMFQPRFQHCLDGLRLVCFNWLEIVLLALIIFMFCIRNWFLNSPFTFRHQCISIIEVCLAAIISSFFLTTPMLKYNEGMNFQENQRYYV